MASVLASGTGSRSVCTRKSAPAAARGAHFPGAALARPSPIAELGHTMTAGAGDTNHRVTLWHHVFAALLAERGPDTTWIQAEPTLSTYPRRPDFLLLERPRTEAAPARDARMLRGLWPRLTRAALVELKSPGRDFRRTELVRLLGYGVQYHEQHLSELAGPADLSLVLVMLRPTPSLLDEVAHMAWSLEPLEPGYARIQGVMYTTYVVFSDEVAAAEDDDFMRIFSHHQVRSRETRWWLEQWLQRTTTMSEYHQDPREIEGYEEVLQKLLESLPLEERFIGLSPEERVTGLSPEERLRGLDPEQRVIGLDPEQRVIGLGPEQRLLLLPDEALRALSDDYLRTLSPATQARIRERIGRPA
jgi:hypothetical protein